jgi:TP901 family phage tail tape measure protein
MARSVIEVNINQTVTGSATVSGLAANLQSLSKNIIVVQNSISGMKDRLAATVTTFAALSASFQSVSSAIGQLAQGYNDYDKAMRSVNTMAGKDETGFKDLKTQISELAKTIPLAKDQLANGLYQVISNGVPENNWISYLEASAKASVGGIADLGQTVTVTSTIIKNYGLSWEQAGDIQDKIQLTAKNGVTSFEQLAGALPKVAGSAATLGISIDELMASFATLTGVSGSTDEVATQLVAVMSALTKPTTEATKLAEEMGIQFNAAAIKAAGGMQQFLSQLVVDVQHYAQQTGQLETEIYSTLFGSSRAIRGLIPLTGELADKFKSNIADMANSAGTIDGAFENMNSTSEAATQRIKNQMSALTGLIGQYAAAAQPVMQYVAITGQAILGLSALNATLTTVAAKIKTMTVAIIGQSASLKIQNFHLNNMIRVEKLLTAITGRTTISFTALNVATKALYITISAGLIWVVTELISLFSEWLDKTDDIEEKTDVLQSGQDTYKTTVANTSVELDKQIQKLGELIQTNADTSDTVEELNNKYGKIFGTYQTASEWYKVLISNSKAYTEQLGNEAAAIEYATEKARKTIDRDALVRQQDKLVKSDKITLKFRGKDGSIKLAKGAKEDVKEYQRLEAEINALNKDIYSLEQNYTAAIGKSKQYAAEIKTNVDALSSSPTNISWQEQSITQLEKTLAAQEKKVKSLADGKNPEAKKEADILAKMKLRLTTLQKIYGLSTKTSKTKTEKYNGDKYIEGADGLKELENNLKYYDNAIAKANTEDKDHIRTLQDKRNEIQDQINSIKLLYEELGLPIKCDSLSDFDKWLSHLNAASDVASSEQLPQLYKKIKEVQQARDDFEDKANPILNISDIKSYEELDETISRVNTKYNKASKENRAELIKKRKELEKLRQSWEDYEADLSKPGDIAQINNLRELADAETYYNNLRERGDATEIANAHKMLALIEKRRNALTVGETIADHESSVEDISKYGKKSMQIEIQAIGIDGLTDKIRELQKLLADGNLTSDQEQRVRSLIGTYDGWRKSMARSFGTLKEGYGNIKSVGNALISMHDTLKNSGSAWEKITSLIDSFIQLYEGISGIVSIINSLSSMTSIFTGTKTAETVATETSTAATGANAAAQAEQVVETVPLIAANKAATASYVELAAAAYMAAHAAMPIVGFGIGSGFATNAAALVKTIGLMPFAKGGVISGPTVGLLGEYAGARNNPEVVAPLDKLRDIIEPRSTFDGGKVEFVIKGRRLEGILNKELKHSTRI